jgi:hypothetical protein
MTPDPNATPTDAELFRYGWRYVSRPRPDGGVEQERQPLTLEDVLHPLEGDVIPERPVHEIDRRYLASVLSTRELRPHFVHITSGCLVDWRIPGVSNHAPDVAVFVGLSDEPDLTEGTFHVVESGGRCLAVFEVVSPDTRENDVVRKMDHYHRAGVPLYTIIDWPRESAPRVFKGYRRGATGFEELPLEENGQLYLRRLGLRLALRDGRVVCFEGQTGKELGDYAAVSRELDEMEKVYTQDRQDIEDATLREREARIAWEKSERRAEEESSARTAAEERIRQLEETLRQLQQQGQAKP